ncbi:MAG TPA: TetR/AcrR family transcriptional regulator [Mycobacteriales bacterium]|nr:TetR/AcrR family transcriptional regulator [Mycobacteriales bacterium]
MPTGVAIRDARQQLFAAAERILQRDGPNALTSRAVTAEAGCAKGVLHRHFTDFDGFLTELVQDRIRRVEAQSDALLDSAGTGEVVDHLTATLHDLFDPVAIGIVGLITFRDELRSRLRRAGLTGVPVLAQAGTMIRVYLDRENQLGRLATGADTKLLALSLIGTGHLLFAGDPAPAEQDVRGIVTTVLNGLT